MSKDIDRLFEEIKRRGSSIAKFAKEMDIPVERVYQWKKGNGKPKVEDAKKVTDWINGNTKQEPVRSDSPVTGFQITVEDYIAEIKQHKEFLQQLLMKNSEDMGQNLKTISSDLTQIKTTDDAHWKQVTAAIETSLKSLARLEKKPEVSLVEEMGNALRHKYLKSETKDIVPEKRK